MERVRDATSETVQLAVLDARSGPLRRQDQRRAGAAARTVRRVGLRLQPHAAGGGKDPAVGRGRRGVEGMAGRSRVRALHAQFDHVSDAAPGGDRSGSDMSPSPIAVPERMLCAACVAVRSPPSSGCQHRGDDRGSGATVRLNRREPELAASTHRAQSRRPLSGSIPGCVCRTRRVARLESGGLREADHAAAGSGKARGLGSGGALRRGWPAPGGLRRRSITRRRTGQRGLAAVQTTVHAQGL